MSVGLRLNLRADWLRLQRVESVGREKSSANRLAEAPRTTWLSRRIGRHGIEVTGGLLPNAFSARSRAVAGSKECHGRPSDAKLLQRESLFTQALSFIGRRFGQPARSREGH